MICIIPAAGKGSRWAPISGYLPKEMLPLIDRPVIEWVIQEAAVSGCKHVIVVINKQKHTIQDYLTKNKKLHDKVKISFVYQDTPRGIAHAIYLAKEYLIDEHFAVALPDLPTISRKPVLKQMFEAYKKLPSGSNLVSLCSFPPETLQFYTECLLKPGKNRVMEIVHFCPKSSVAHHPEQKVRMSGRYVFSKDILENIKKLLDQTEVGEVTDRSILELSHKIGQPVIGLNIEGHTYDTGNPESYIRANTAFFKKRLNKLA